MEYWGAHTGAEVDAALAAIDSWSPDAVLVFAGVIASSHADRFAAWSLRRRIPTVSEGRLCRRRKPDDLRTRDP
jgi:hypothetical protein